jgi:hypothetical protein
MSGALHELAEVRVWLAAESGPPLLGDRDAVALMGEADEALARFVAIPVARCGDAFFRLRTRILGEVLQKFATYGVRCAIVGDVSRHVAESDALRDFVREANRGRQFWFVETLTQLEERLARER